MPGRVRALALAIPLLMLCYGLLWWVDGADGGRGPGLAWDLRHSSLLLSILLLGVLTVDLRRLIPAQTPRARFVGNAAVAVGLFGMTCLAWAIFRDLVEEAPSLPVLLQVGGPLAFQLGFFTLMGALVVARPRRLPVWSPVLVFVSLLLLRVDLRLSPLGALVLLVALAPLARLAPQVPEPAHR